MEYILFTSKEATKDHMNLSGFSLFSKTLLQKDKGFLVKEQMV